MASAQAYDDSVYQTMKGAFLSLYIPGMAYGAYSVLMSASSYVLLRQGIIRSKTSFGMFSVTFIMFASATAAAGIQGNLALRELVFTLNPSLGIQWANSTVRHMTAAMACLDRLIYILSDAVVAWRAATIWMWDLKVSAFLGLCMIATFACSIADVSLSLSELYRLHAVVDDGSAVKLGERSLILVLPLLALNVFATSLIAYKAWQHRQLLKPYDHDLQERKMRSLVYPVEDLLILLVESGLIYCILWALYLLSSFHLFNTVGFTVFDGLMPYLSAIYPTIIIVIVSVQKSQIDRFATYQLEESISFASAPATASRSYPGRTTVELSHPTSPMMQGDHSFSTNQSRVHDMVTETKLDDQEE